MLASPNQTDLHQTLLSVSVGLRDRSNGRNVDYARLFARSGGLPRRFILFHGGDVHYARACAIGWKRSTCPIINHAVFKGEDRVRRKRERRKRRRAVGGLREEHDHHVASSVQERERRSFLLLRDDRTAIHGVCIQRWSLTDYYTLFREQRLFFFSLSTASRHDEPSWDIQKARYDVVRPPFIPEIASSHSSVFEEIFKRDQFQRIIQNRQHRAL